MTGTPGLPSRGHLLAREQIARHGRDRYPHPMAQYFKVLDELRELGVALEESRTSYVVSATGRVRDELADVGLALHALGDKLGLDLIEEMDRLVSSDTRDFREEESKL